MDWPCPVLVIVSSSYEVCASSTSWPGQGKKVFKTGLKSRLPQGVFWHVNSFIYFLPLFPFCSGFPSEIMARNLNQPCANWCAVLSDRVKPELFVFKCLIFNKISFSSLEWLIGLVLIQLLAVAERQHGELWCHMPAETTFPLCANYLPSLFESCCWNAIQHGNR